jgi:hypothetical protein
MKINPADLDQAEEKLGGYRIKALDIVLLRTDSAKRHSEKLSHRLSGNDQGGRSPSLGKISQRLAVIIFREQMTHSRKISFGIENL